MKLNKNLVALLTLSSFVSSSSPAADQVRTGWAAGDIQQIASIYNEHLKIDSNFEKTYFPESLTKKNPELATLHDYVTKQLAQAEGQITELPKATVDHQSLLFTVMVKGDKARQLKIDFSKMSRGTLVVNGHELAWNPAAPIQARIDALRNVLKKDFGAVHTSSTSWLIPNAYAVIGIDDLIIAGIVMLIVTIISLWVIPYFRRAHISSINKKMSELAAETKVEKDEACSYQTDPSTLNQQTIDVQALENTLKTDVDGYNSIKTNSSYSVFKAQFCSGAPLDSDTPSEIAANIQTACQNLAAAEQCRQTDQQAVSTSLDKHGVPVQVTQNPDGTLGLSIPGAAPATQ